MDCSLADKFFVADTYPLRINVPGSSEPSNDAT